jgi:hypothetical protein
MLLKLMLDKFLPQKKLLMKCALTLSSWGGTISHFAIDTITACG